MNTKHIDSLPSVKCNVVLNKEYKRLNSQSILLENKNDTAEFEFIVAYPKDKANYTTFSVKTEFKEDTKGCRVSYRIDNKDKGAIILTGYNVTKDANNNNITNDYTIHCNMRELLKVADKTFYIKPRIDVHVDGTKEITIDLYTK